MCAKVVMLRDIRDTQRCTCDALWGQGGVGTVTTVLMAATPCVTEDVFPL